MALDRFLFPERHSYGFTLLEVLVALAIFALAASVLMVTDGRSTRQVARVQETVKASMIADTHLNRLYVEQTFPATGKTATVVTQNEQSWYVQDVVSATGQGNLRRIEVQVFPGEDAPKGDAQPLYRLIGFVRRAANAQ